MKWLVVVSIAALSVLAATSTAAADEGKGFPCNGVFSSGTIKSVTVPDNGACTLLGSTITGNVDWAQARSSRRLGLRFRAASKARMP